MGIAQANRRLKHPTGQFDGLLPLLIPSLAGVVILFVAPFLDTVRYSVTQTASGTFVGMENYANVLSNGSFLLACKNTAAFMAFNIPILLLSSFVISVFTTRKSRFNTIVKSILLLPLAIPVFTSSIIVQYAFGDTGWINSALLFFHLPTVSWLSSDNIFWTLSVDYCLRNLGYCVVLWSAALSCIPQTIYEASALDGASPRQTVLHVLLPSLAPGGFVVTMLAVINCFKIYREAYLVAGSYPPETIYMIPHLFNNWFASLSISSLSAASVLIILFIGLFISFLFVAWKAEE